ncbi:hypothetical protein [Chitinimonas sp.]|uniref:hypothetical protein n=1 Tax=Chitinimonas sp. TaxID=1934313 RepID=UPI0035B0AECB
MIQVTRLHEDAFYEFFKPYRHPQAKHDIWGGYGLETFGDDFQLVRSLDLDYVWTVVDGDSGDDQWITPGIRYVNRVCYLVTEIPHRGLEVDFRCSQQCRSLTSLGLKRQLNKLVRAWTSTH